MCGKKPKVKSARGSFLPAVRVPAVPAAASISLIPGVFRFMTVVSVPDVSTIEFERVLLSKAAGPDLASL